LDRDRCRSAGIIVAGNRIERYPGHVGRRALAGNRGDAKPKRADIFLSPLHFVGRWPPVHERPRANPYRVSLPAYQSIFAGAVQDCAHNKCGRVSTETFPERFVREFKLHPKKVATLASWNRIACAVESKAKTTFVNAGDEPLFDGPMDSEQRNNNMLQGDKQWESEHYRKAGRLDEHTYRHAITYLHRHRPNFMFISFVDADFYGHQQDYPGYTEALHRYDRWLEELIETLNTMGEYGRKTTVIMTTDPTAKLRSLKTVRFRIGSFVVSSRIRKPAMAQTATTASPTMNEESNQSARSP